EEQLDPPADAQVHLSPGEPLGPPFRHGEELPDPFQRAGERAYEPHRPGPDDLAPARHSHPPSESCQETPKRSLSQAYLSANGYSVESGIITKPPSERRSNSRSISASLSQETNSESEGVKSNWWT